MKTSVESFSCDASSHRVIAALQKRLEAQGPGMPVSRSFTIRWLIHEGGKCAFSKSEFSALVKGAKPVKWGGAGNRIRRAKSQK